MSDEDQSDEREDTEAKSAPSARKARDELFTALGHLSNAARILIDAADPAVRKAATDAEKAIERVTAEAEPIAKQVGDELAKLTRNVVGAIDRVVGEPSTSGGDRSADDDASAEHEPSESEGRTKKSGDESAE